MNRYKHPGIAPWQQHEDQTHHEPPPQEEEKVAKHKSHCGVHCQNEGPAVH